MADCPICGGEELDDEDREAEDRWAIKRMTESIKQNPDLAKQLWLVLKLAGEKP